MNRRSFFKRFGPAVLVTAPVVSEIDVAAEPKRALAAVVPICPDCGCQVPFERPSAHVGDLVPVRCGCGWSGVSPVAV